MAKNLIAASTQMKQWLMELLYKEEFWEEKPQKILKTYY
jgi:hypothetical protein